MDGEQIEALCQARDYLFRRGQHAEGAAVCAAIRELVGARPPQYAMCSAPHPTQANLSCLLPEFHEGDHANGRVHWPWAVG